MPKRYSIAAFIFAAALALLPASARAQSRGRVVLQDPGQMRIIGGSAVCPNGESSGDENAVSPDGQNWGGLQINLVNYAGDPYDLLDPAINVAVGHDVWLSQGYAAWACDRG